MKKTDLAYIVGIIDGEGCIGIAHRKTKHHGVYYSANVSVAMVEEYIERWLQMSFGGSVCIQRARKKTHRDCYRWYITSKQAVDFLQAILPYLKIKRPQAEIAIKVEKLKPGYRKWATPLEKYLQEIEARKLVNPRGQKSDP